MVDEAIRQLEEEGLMQVLFPTIGRREPILGTVGPLQLDVLKVRLSEEYDLEINFEQPEFQLARWIFCEDGRKLEEFVQNNYSSCAEDLDGDRVFMARNQFILDFKNNNKEMQLGQIIFFGDK